MALEINEIGIRMRVADANPREQPSSIPAAKDDCSNLDQQQIVEDCVLRVLRILAQREGR